MRNRRSNYGASVTILCNRFNGFGTYRNKASSLALAGWAWPLQC